ncbi:COMM domain-containing protein 7-like [Fopius arisanus]|uniref:COMM domain-containing protein 7-like n=1 Tax=Fopius arisanus TaxID=64838 RepID=A0A9R1TTR9_9HYME|nr:PREDICTED: COMM domain-containing protein 7-like [Fopius arisanus]XP_011298226.1 PREDICTED: COMM domain-containing protein 7-like [Fopius arisanus]
MDDSGSKIVDVSWKFGVTAASSESDKVGKTFLQLRLLLDDNGKKSDVFTEMTLSQFYKFLHDLEKAKNSLDLLV